MVDRCAVHCGGPVCSSLWWTGVRGHHAPCTMHPKTLTPAWLHCTVFAAGVAALNTAVSVSATQSTKFAVTSDSLTACCYAGAGRPRVQSAECGGNHGNQSVECGGNHGNQLTHVSIKWCCTAVHLHSESLSRTVPTPKDRRQEGGGGGWWAAGGVAASSATWWSPAVLSNTIPPLNPPTTAPALSHDGSIARLSASMPVWCVCVRGGREGERASERWWCRRWW